MTVNARAFSPAHSKNPSDVEALQALVIVCGAGLLLSLLLALNGWI